MFFICYSLVFDFWFLYRSVLKPILVKRARSDNFVGLVTVSGYLSDWIHPSGSSMHMTIDICRTLMSNLMFLRC